VNNAQPQHLHGCTLPSRLYPIHVILMIPACRRALDHPRTATLRETRKKLKKVFGPLVTSETVAAHILTFIAVPRSSLLFASTIVPRVDHAMPFLVAAEHGCAARSITMLALTNVAENPARLARCDPLRTARRHSQHGTLQALERSTMDGVAGGARAHEGRANGLWPAPRCMQGWPAGAARGAAVVDSPSPDG
jgi:hypothetical protein